MPRRISVLAPDIEVERVSYKNKDLWSNYRAHFYIHNCCVTGTFSPARTVDELTVQNDEDSTFQQGKGAKGRS